MSCQGRIEGRCASLPHAFHALQNGFKTLALADGLTPFPSSLQGAGGAVTAAAQAFAAAAAAGKPGCFLLCMRDSKEKPGSASACA